MHFKVYLKMFSNFFSSSHFHSLSLSNELTFTGRIYFFRLQCVLGVKLINSIQFYTDYVFTYVPSISYTFDKIMTVMFSKNVSHFENRDYRDYCNDRTKSGFSIEFVCNISLSVVKCRDILFRW